MTRYRSRAAKALTPIFHPHWSPADDRAVLMGRARRDSFDAIARDLGRGARAVEQRWHRLRAVPCCAQTLRDYGLNAQPYPVEGVRHG
jgi:hypothetical protein